MLAETGVAATSGVAFDRTRGNRFPRCSYCGPEADMREAAVRLHGENKRRSEASASFQMKLPSLG